MILLKYNQALTANFFDLSLMSLQLMLSCLSTKTTVLYQLMLVTGLLCNVSMKVMLLQCCTGINIFWVRNQGSSLPFLKMTKLVLLLANS